MIALGFLAAIAVGMFRAKRSNLDSNMIPDIALLCLIFGFIGAKVLFVIVEFPAFSQNPWLVFSGEGFVVYGGIISGVLAAIIYCKKKKCDFYRYLDILIPSVALAQGFGRIGCFLAGCCYGRATTDWYGVTFPEGSIAPAGIPLIPTQLISAGGDFLLAAFLILYSKHAKYKGNVGAVYLVLYGIGRFLIEFLRNDERGGVGFLSTSQFISLFIVIGGLVLYWRSYKQKRTLML
jgi:Prolipoprotein diacylglyceryltransferase